MKRFSLDRKRAKVLALILAAAMVVPSVPAAKSDAAASGKAVKAPTPIATLDFADADSYEIATTVAKQLKFTDATEASVWAFVNDKGEPTNVGDSGGYPTFYSINNVPEMKQGVTRETTKVFTTATGSAAGVSIDAVIASTNPDDYVWEEIDVTPEVVPATIEVASGNETIEITGKALSLKDAVTVGTQYPKNGKRVNYKDKKYSIVDYTVNEAGKFQKTATYAGGAEVQNPFAGSTKLYDASRYSMENIAKTATEIVVATNAPALGGPEKFMGEAAGNYTKQKVTSGVSISFWGKAPADATEGFKDTNFIEFYNDESLVYQTDSLAKVWASYMYEEANDSAKNGEGSLFYHGDVATGTIVAVGQYECNYWQKSQTYDLRTDGPTLCAILITAKGQEVNEENLKDKGVGNIGSCNWPATAGPITVSFVENNGPFMYFNHSAGEWYADQETIKGYGDDDFNLVRYTNDNHAVKVLVPYNTCTLQQFTDNWKKGACRNGLLVSTGKEGKNADGEQLYTLIRETTDIWLDFYAEGESTGGHKTSETDDKGNHPYTQAPRNYAEANPGQYGNFIPDEETARTITTETGETADASKVGVASNVGKGITGFLGLATNKSSFLRDYNTTGRGVNKTNDQYGLLKAFQADNQGTVNYSDIGDASEWHYYTYTITDEWFQMYVDGEAVEADGADVGNQFNMGSGMFNPNGVEGKNVYRHSSNTGDIRRLYSYDNALGSDYGWSKCAWGYGYFLGDTIMKFITDENTKLFIGGKTQVVAAGTEVANVCFYDQVLTAEQVEGAYLEALGVDAAEIPDAPGGDEPGGDEPGGDEPGGDEPGGDEPGVTDSAIEVLLGDVNNDKKIDSADALEALREEVDIAHAGTFYKEAADVDGNKKVDSADALAMLRHEIDIVKIEGTVKIKVEAAK